MKFRTIVVTENDTEVLIVTPDLVIPSNTQSEQPTMENNLMEIQAPINYPDYYLDMVSEEVKNRLNDDKLIELFIVCEFLYSPNPRNQLKSLRGPFLSEELAKHYVDATRSDCTRVSHKLNLTNNFGISDKIYIKNLISNL